MIGIGIPLSPWGFPWALPLLATKLSIPYGGRDAARIHPAERMDLRRASVSSWSLGWTESLLGGSPLLPSNTMGKKETIGATGQRWGCDCH